MGYTRLVSVDPSSDPLKLMWRQDHNMRYILYVDSGTKFSVRSGNERLPYKIGSGRQHGIPVAYRGTYCS